MNTVVFEHVRLSDLPAAWRAKLPKTGFAPKSHVTVRIEEDSAVEPAQAQFADDPLFGMWADREDMADVDAYIRKLRAPRFSVEQAQSISDINPSRKGD